MIMNAESKSVLIDRAKGRFLLLSDRYLVCLSVCDTLRWYKGGEKYCRSYTVVERGLQ